MTLTFLVTQACIFVSCEPQARKYSGASEMYPTVNLNIRKGPGTNYEILKTVKPNTKLLIADSSSSGFVMVLRSDSTKYGWASLKYLQGEPPKTKKRTKAEKTIYEEFKIDYSLQGRTMNISLKTDLPDKIKVTVSVSRSYWRMGNSSEYAVDYISEQGTIGDWKQKREILIDDEKWKSDLDKLQRELARATIPFDIDRISDSIEINAVVPLSNNPYPNFKEEDSGKDEVKIRLPISVTVDKESKYGNYEALKIGRTYSISKTTPLMSEFDPSDPIADIMKMKKLVTGSRITVLSTKDNYGPWYEVNATDKTGNKIGKGWINSNALIGQELLIVN